jgi:hypothetical protein
LPTEFSEAYLDYVIREMMVYKSLEVSLSNFNKIYERVFLEAGPFPFMILY